MKHFGVFLSDLESERFLAATNDQVATWLFLHAFCSKQLNGGTIPEAASLSERFWSRHGIEKTTLDQPSPLWSWDGDCLSVEPYDIDGQTLYEKKVRGGKKGMAKRWGGNENRSLNKSPNRPNLTLPNLTLPNPTLPNQTLRDSSSKDEANGCTQEAIQFASWFKSSLPPETRPASNWRKIWAKTYDDLVNKDRRPPEEIRAVCKFARTDNFWQSNFQSPTKLRKRNKDGILFYDLFLMKMKQTTNNKRPTNNNRPTVNTGLRTETIEEQ